MSGVFDVVTCPKCGMTKYIDKKEQQTFCQICAIYFNRDGGIEDYDKIRLSARPLYDSLDPIADWVKEIAENRRKILDDFCKAYLAENYMPIKCLELVEERTDKGCKWYFRIKPEVIDKMNG